MERETKRNEEKAGEINDPRTVNWRYRFFLKSKTVTDAIYRRIRVYQISIYRYLRGQPDRVNVTASRIPVF